MSIDNRLGGDDRRDDQPKEGGDVSRRGAFGRFAQYTAPVMLALLTSEASASTSIE
jgi:hypothetical protein